MSLDVLFLVLGPFWPFVARREARTSLEGAVARHSDANLLHEGGDCERHGDVLVLALCF